ncbi:MAG TPA: hypothetical protein VG125_27500 [Pirellulales bacterium]|nr:hypothetical protein [Pirellulales bacterium]
MTAEEREAKTQELKKKEKEKPDFQFIKYAVQPGGTEGAEDRPEVYVKPGHWTSATLRSRANNFDFRGELLSEAHDQAARPVPLDEVPFHLRTTRPVILPKGQQRLLEFSIFMPVETRSKSISTRLLTGPGGRPVYTESQVLKPLAPHQYYLVVLAVNANTYSFIRRLDSVTAPTALDNFTDPLTAHHYRVALPQIKTSAPLPSQPLGWTSIAYVLWDDLEPKKLSIEQQQAMLDWLHWGGQLIVSGPESLATLKGSFLDEFLPATAGDTWQLKADALEPLNKTWHEGDRPLKAVRAWSGVHLKLASGGQALVSAGDEPLVAERRAGRGRIVLTAFRLSQRELRDWPSFDNFFNNVLLRRPPRQFRFENELLSVRWRDDYPSHDERRISQVRYFTRDAQVPATLMADLMRARAVAAPPPSNEFEPANPTTPYNRFGMPAYQPGEGEPSYGSGAAGWNDFSATSNVALDALRKAAGISVPDARFVVLVLGTYITVLVPVNWLFFRLLGRVEWAWAAAPFISIGGAIAVVYLAQLDIGFARSKSELAVMELHSTYRRAHLTRYLALYSSLGTRYQLRFDDQSAVALPFAAGQRMLVGQGVGAVDYRRTPQLGDENEEVAQVTLDGLEISSNTTGMVHSEEMLDAGGGFGWQSLGGNRYRLANDTRFAWEGVAVIGPRQTAWVGSLGAGAAATVELIDRLPEADPWLAQLNDSPVTSDRAAEGLNLRDFYRLAQNQISDETSVNELRVVGWTKDEVAGLTIRPGASQSRQLTFVVGHLDYGPVMPVSSDQGSRRLAYQAAGKLPPPENEEEESGAEEGDKE